MAALFVFITGASSVQAATRTKANNSNNLNLGTSWSGGTAPGAADVALWNSTVTGANTVLLGGNLTWGEIQIINPGGTVTISAGNTLTLNGIAGVGIDMSTATQNLTLNCNVTVGAAQSWNVASTQTITVGGTVDVNGFSLTIQNLSGSGVIINNSNNTAPILTLNSSANTTFSGTIDKGTGNRDLGLTKTGTSVLTLSGNNTYNLATTISAGAINIQHANALGSTTAGTTVNSGAALQIQGGITTATEALTLNGAGVSADGALRNISGNNTYAGVITLGSATRINSDSGTLTLNSGTAISGATFGLTVGGAGDTTISSGINTTTGTVTKDGAGKLTLSGASSYTGATAINAGVLNIQNNTALGTVAGGVTVASGAALELQNNITVGAEALNLNGTGISSGGALRNISGNNTYGGAVTLAGATRINSDAGLLTLNSGTAISGATFGLTVGGAGNTTISSAINTTSGSLTKDGAGVLTVSGANSFTGGVTIDNGEVKLGNAGALNSTTPNTVAFNANANTKTLTLNANSVSIGGLSYANTDNNAIVQNNAAGTAVLTVTNTANNTFGGRLQNGATGTLALKKSGGGTLTLGGANTYTGATTIDQGTLVVNGSLANTAVAINNGGTLAGSGTITGTVTANNNSHLAPGNNNIGTLATGVTVLNAGSIYDVELGTAGTHASPGTSDRTTVTGSLTLGGTLNLIDNAGANGQGSAGAGSYRIFAQTGTPSGSFSTINSLSGLHAKVDTATSGSTFLDLYRLAAASRSPATMNFVNYHVGDLSTDQIITLNNTAANDNFSEKLDATLGATAGITTSGSVSLLAAGASDTTSLKARINTSSAGNKAGTVTLALNSNGSGTSGFGTTALASQTVSVTGGSVFRLAAASRTPTTLTFANYHVGDASADQIITLNNTAATDGFSEKLDATLGATAGITTSGSVSLLAAGASNTTSLNAHIDTSSVGAKAGTVTLTLNSNGSGTSGLGTTALASQTVTVTGGSVFRLASANTLGNVAFGNFHVGATLSQALTLNNTATADGFSEGLKATLNGLTGGATVSGLPTSLIAAGGNAGLTVGLSNWAGSQSGTVVLNRTSDGTGTSGLGTTSLSTDTVNVSGTGYRLAAANTITTPINLGNVHVGGGPFGTQTLLLQNTAINDGYSEKLDAAFGTLTGDASNNGGSVSLLAAQGTDNSNLVVGLGNANTGSAGLKTGTTVVTLTSNGSGTSGLGTTGLTAQTITINGGVFSGNATWAGSNGSYGTAANWADDVTPTIQAAPGTFTGFDNVDQATFNGSGGTVSLNGTSPSLNTIVFDGANAYTLAQGSSGNVILKGSGAGVTVNSASAAHAISAPVQLLSDALVDVVNLTGQLTISGTISGSTSLTKSGAGTLTVSGANSYSGDTTVNAGTLKVVATNVIPTGSGKGNVVLNAGTLDVNGNDATINGLSGASGSEVVNNANGTSKTLTVGNANAAASFAGVIRNNNNAGSGILGLTKTGSGTQILSGNNSYTGATLVSDGTLQVNGSIANSSLITVGSAGTLKGIGTVADLSLAGTIAPGNSVGTINVGDTTWLNGSDFMFEIDDATGTVGQNNGPGWDLLNITGTLNIASLTAGGFTIDIDTLLTGGGTTSGSMANFSSTGTYNWEFVRTSAGFVGSFDLADYTFDLTGFMNSHTPSAFGVAQLGNSLYVTYTGNSGNAIPEPSTMVLWFSILMTLFVVYRRRQVA